MTLAPDFSDQFINNGYLNIALGTEFKTFSFLKPQIEFGYVSALLNEEDTRDENFKINGISQGKFSAFNIGITPKWLVYMDKAGWYSINILPKYTYSQVTGSNSYTSVQLNGDVDLPYKTEKTAGKLHSFGIGIGICVNHSKRNNDSMAFNLYFNNIEYGSIYNKIKFLKEEVYTNNMVGLGLVYFFSLKNNIEKGFLEPK